jgi:alpha-glucosidase
VSATNRWWETAVFYQIYPRSFSDGNGDGTGDLVGVRERLPYLRDLGVDALWLSPFFRSPMIDGGYDVADPCDVDPIFGTLADFDALVEAAHGLDMRVTIDVVPNHFSTEHHWFRSALVASPGSSERARFIFRPSGNGSGELPNNWPSMFGGPAWTWVPSGNNGDGEFYLHLFAREQADLDWTNPEVPAEFERIFRFWLDRGVDGFRIDVAHGMAKPAGLPDLTPAALVPRGESHMPQPEDVRWDNEAVHDHHRHLRSVLDSYPGDRMAIGEVWVADDARLARYARPDELNLTFNFELIVAHWGTDMRDAIVRSMAAMAGVGAPCTWVLANHDVDRVATRYGGGAVGLARARAAALIQLSLPGAAYVYNGDELGLENADLPDDALQDPIWERTGHAQRGRDGERVPLPWSGSAPPFGFSTGASSWLPMPASWAGLTAADQAGDATSTLSLYRRALALRREHPDFHSGDFAWLNGPADTFGYRRGDVEVWVNHGTAPVPLPAGDVLLASGPLDPAGLVPPDTTVWLS